MNKSLSEELSALSDDDLKYKESLLKDSINEKRNYKRDGKLTSLEIDLCYVQREINNRRLRVQL
jgi:hypothetical protein